MSTIAATVTTKSQEFPPGTVAGQWLFALLDVNGIWVQQTSTDAHSATFLNVSPGSYSIRVWRKDSAGNYLGDPAMTTVSIAAPSNVTIDVPDTVTATVS